MRLSEPAKRALRVRMREAYQLHNAGLNNKRVSHYMKEFRGWTRTEQWVSQAVKWCKEDDLSTGK